MRPTAAASIVLLIFQAGVFAADPEPLSLNEALRRALQKATAVRIAEKTLVDADLLIREAYSNLWPRVTGSAAYTRFPQEISLEFEGNEAVIQPLDTKTFGLRVEQPLYQSRVKPLGRAARENMNSVRQAFMNSVNELAYGVGDLYFAVLTAGETIRIVRESEKNRARHLEVVSAKFAVGELPETSVLEAEYALESVELKAAEARHSLENLETAFRILLRLEEERRLVPPELKEVPRTPDALDAGRWLPAARENHPVLRELRFLRHSTRFMHDAVRAEFYPSFSAFFNLDYNPEVTAFSPERDTWTAGVSLSWPFFERGTRLIRLRRTRNQISLLERRIEREEERIENAVTKILNAMKTVLKSMEAHDKQIRLAEKIFELRKEQLNVGLATSTDVLDAETDYLAARIARNLDGYRLKRHYLELLKETGALIPYFELEEFSARLAEDALEQR
jgi:outer membrane protein TolC